MSPGYTDPGGLIDAEVAPFTVTGVAVTEGSTHIARSWSAG
jgi:hypothetical protein